MIRQSSARILLATFLLATAFAGPAATEEERPREPAAPEFALPPLEQLNAIIERPLFLRGRRPLEAPEPETAAPEEEPMPEAGAQMTLAGIATDQADRAVAIVQDINSGTSFRAWVGDEVAGWTVKAIRPRVVVLARGESEVEVTLDAPAWPPEEGD